MKTIIQTFLLASVVSLTAGIAHSAVLPIGGSTVVTGTTAAAEPQLAGTIVNDNILTSPILNIPDPSSIFFVGFDIQNRVVQSDVNGTLIFAPRIRFVANVTAGNFLIDTLELFGFGEFATDVAYRTDGLGDVGPTFAERPVGGEWLLFDFGFPIVVGNLTQSTIQESRFLSIETNATQYENTGFARIRGRHVDYPGQTFQFEYTGLAVPTITPVPVPASFVLLLSGLGAVFGWRKRRET